MKKTVSLLMFASAFVLCATAQEKPDVQEELFQVVDEMPEYPGGQDSLFSFIAKNVEYPVAAQDKEIEGKVYIGFVVDETGTVTNARVLRGVDPDLDKEALRVINLLEKWTPGKEKGKAVKVEYTFPISFALK